MDDAPGTATRMPRCPGWRGRESDCPYDESGAPTIRRIRATDPAASKRERAPELPRAPPPAHGTLGSISFSILSTLPHTLAEGPHGQKTGPISCGVGPDLLRGYVVADPRPHRPPSSGVSFSIERIGSNRLLPAWDRWPAPVFDSLPQPSEPSALHPASPERSVQVSKHCALQQDDVYCVGYAKFGLNRSLSLTPSYSPP
jgi:hypothetical protein